MNIKRRRLLQLGSLGLGSFFSNRSNARSNNFFAAGGKKPVVISTWDAGINANKAAWNVLRGGGRALDAVEQGVMVTESEQSCCVGLNAYPDRDGFVTLDASIMDEFGNAGSVAFIERIKHPISVARRVMEKTPHVMLAGAGAQQFAVEQGFPLESGELSNDAKKAYEQWLKKSEYKPIVNIENKGGTAFAPLRLPNGDFNHDTIGMVALDAKGNLGGSCTTSGMAFKVRGRVGDSPIIGAGLFVDNEVGAATSTGVGEEVIKACGTHLVVQYMAQGLSPEDACKKAVEKIIKNFKGREDKLKDTQVAFIAVNKQGEYGAYAIQKGFNYAVCYADDYNTLIDSKHIL
ncbi:MAG TPA: N(4)-(beta-N-acetylglucosaminyl)-L-asparaginase [Chitinophagaceae bacterium]|nr:N(4)-(beta-N-acetylglucosaminyl)-L-asparaginase [Chitinophagaceae bacterium]